MPCVPVHVPQGTRPAWLAGCVMRHAFRPVAGGWLGHREWEWEWGVWGGKWGKIGNEKAKSKEQRNNGNLIARNRNPLIIYPNPNAPAQQPADPDHWS